MHTHLGENPKAGWICGKEDCKQIRLPTYNTKAQSIKVLAGGTTNTAMKDVHCGIEIRISEIYSPLNIAKKYELTDAKTTLCALNVSSPIFRIISHNYNKAKKHS